MKALFAFVPRFDLSSLSAAPQFYGAQPIKVTPWSCSDQVDEAGSGPRFEAGTPASSEVKLSPRSKIETGLCDAGLGPSLGWHGSKALNNSRQY